MNTNFFYLFLFSVIGAALMFALTWLKQGKSFNPKSQIAQYAVALIIGGLFSYFFDKKEVLAILMIFAQVAMVYMVSGLLKFGKVQEAPTYNIYGVPEQKKKNLIGYVLIGLFVIGWVFILGAEGMFEKWQTGAEIIGFGCLGLFAIICAVGFSKQGRK